MLATRVSTCRKPDHEGTSRIPLRFHSAAGGTSALRRVRPALAARIDVMAATLTVARIRCWSSGIVPVGTEAARPLCYLAGGRIVAAVGLVALAGLLIVDAGRRGARAAPVYHVAPISLRW